MSKRTKAEIMQNVECESARIVENNTVEYHRSNGDRVIRLHLTDILTFKANGDVELNTDGWTTVTTKARMNEFLPAGWKIEQRKSIWYLNEYTYQDGITIHPDGTVTGNGTSPKELNKLNKQIDKYTKGYVKAFFDGQVPQPSGGDCWGCLFFDQMDKPSNSHLLEHFKEKYYVPKLLDRAIEEIPVSQAALHVIGYIWGMHDREASFWNDIAKSQITSSLKRYLRRRLGLAR